MDGWDSLKKPSASLKIFKEILAWRIQKSPAACNVMFPLGVTKKEKDEEGEKYLERIIVTAKL